MSETSWAAAIRENPEALIIWGDLTVDERKRVIPLLKELFKSRHIALGVKRSEWKGQGVVDGYAASGFYNP